MQICLERATKTTYNFVLFKRVGVFVTSLVLLWRRTMPYSLRNLTITDKISVPLLHRIFHDVCKHAVRYQNRKLVLTSCSIQTLQFTGTGSNDVAVFETRSFVIIGLSGRWSDAILLGALAWPLLPCSFYFWPNLFVPHFVRFAVMASWCIGYDLTNGVM